jgi:hypothetical protein
MRATGRGVERFGGWYVAKTPRQTEDKKVVGCSLLRQADGIGGMGLRRTTRSVQQQFRDGEKAQARAQRC